ncbi:Rrp15p-domain-containing protein [Radiomyces spectabilis]|uniref:Rrp15p-domain-containing protein n=1 Tax=Radiomyces spectabilis TaxID=64574 RepID=UPI00221EE4A1|nr:Rrp15p-domain-containing protein [Radiomyces spectabilis]KAI8391612.1 Rrp15p-domain-containing protein [Radiomyces spectabilis]
MAKKQVQKKGEFKAKINKPEDDVELEEVQEEQMDESSSNEQNDASDLDDDMNESDADESDADDEDDEDEDEEDDEMDLGEDEDKAKKGSSEAFSEAMTKILGRNLSASDKKQPILARARGTERKIEDEKLEYKARKVISAEKKALRSKGRVIPDYTTFEYEKRLRKVATRGVVKLFNAILTQQKATDVAVSRASDNHKTLASLEKAKSVSTMSKSSFLDLLKTGKA